VTELESSETRKCLFPEARLHVDGRASVYVPGGWGEKKNLPVIFWIHGYLLTPLSTNFSLIILSIRKGRVCRGQRDHVHMITIWSNRGCLHPVSARIVRISTWGKC
jgi:hypothetical protein